MSNKTEELFIQILQSGKGSIGSIDNVYLPQLGVNRVKLAFDEYKEFTREFLELRNQIQWHDAIAEKPTRGYYDVVYTHHDHKLGDIDIVGVSQLGDDGIWRCNGEQIPVRLYRSIPEIPKENDDQNTQRR